MNVFANRRRTVITVGSLAAATALGVTVTVLPATADSGARDTGGHGLTHRDGHAAGHGSGTPSGAGTTEGAATAAGTSTVLAASLRGANEVPPASGAAVGDPDGGALLFLRVKGDKVSVAVKWHGVTPPTALHIHDGVKGVNGAIEVDYTPLLGAARGNSLTATVTVTDRTVLQRLRDDPAGFYANLHTAEFPGGAVRGQLHKVTARVDFRHAPDSFQASVVKGEQIYRCERNRAGGHSFAQRDVRAVLDGRIGHTFTRPGSGTPGGSRATAAPSPARSSAGRRTAPRTSPNWTSGQRSRARSRGCSPPPPRSSGSTRPAASPRRGTACPARSRGSRTARTTSSSSADGVPGADARPWGGPCTRTRVVSSPTGE